MYMYLQIQSNTYLHFCKCQSNLYFLFYSDDLRTANIIACDPEGVSCLVIDRETFNQLISGLDEIRTRYKDDDVLERMR